jgi:hypothetical protein
MGSEMNHVGAIIGGLQSQQKVADRAVRTSPRSPGAAAAAVRFLNSTPS